MFLFLWMVVVISIVGSIELIIDHISQWRKNKDFIPRHLFLQHLVIQGIVLVLNVIALFVIFPHMLDSFMY